MSSTYALLTVCRAQLENIGRLSSPEINKSEVIELYEETKKILKAAQDGIEQLQRYSFIEDWELYSREKTGIIRKIQEDPISEKWTLLLNVFDGKLRLIERFKSNLSKLGFCLSEEKFYRFPHISHENVKQQCCHKLNIELPSSETTAGADVDADDGYASDEEWNSINSSRILALFNQRVENELEEIKKGVRDNISVDGKSSYFYNHNYTSQACELATSYFAEQNIRITSERRYERESKSQEFKRSVDMRVPRLRLSKSEDLI
jgi:hypothetical protein